jgi:hypothetical protein
MKKSFYQQWMIRLRVFLAAEEIAPVLSNLSRRRSRR